jgi:hypothetical protein
METPIYCITWLLIGITIGLLWGALLAQIQLNKDLSLGRFEVLVVFAALIFIGVSITLAIV